MIQFFLIKKQWICSVFLLSSYFLANEADGAWPEAFFSGPIGDFINMTAQSTLLVPTTPCFNLSPTLVLTLFDGCWNRAEKEWASLGRDDPNTWIQDSSFRLNKNRNLAVGQLWEINSTNRNSKKNKQTNKKTSKTETTETSIVKATAETRTLTSVVTLEITTSLAKQHSQHHYKQ